MSSVMRDYQIIAREKKVQQWDKIPKDWRISVESFQDATNVMDIPVTCGLLNDTERKITSDNDATALLEKIKAGVWSVEQVTVAFCKRAAIAQQLVSSHAIELHSVPLEIYHLLITKENGDRRTV